ncbi:MAG: VPLPA-CTERM sorting domain-containing protein [Pseudomonadota bacterium]
MLSLRPLALIFSAAVFLSVPVKANAASVTVGFLLPLFSENYENGTDPFVGSEPASAEISITIDDETPVSGGFDTGTSAESQFAGAVSSYSITIRDSADTSGATLANFLASGGGVASISVADNFTTSTVGEVDFISFFIDPDLADSATGALSDFDLLNVTAFFQTETLSSTGLENVNQANLDAAFLSPNLAFSSDDFLSSLTFVPALAFSVARTNPAPDLNDLSILITEEIVFGNDITAVPLPPAGLMLLAGIAGFLGMRRRV